MTEFVVDGVKIMLILGREEWFADSGEPGAGSRPPKFNLIW